jgi:hypothetical protein
MMKHLLPYTALIVAALAGSPALSDPGFGTPDEAKAMLERAVVEVRTNKAAALEKFNHNEMPFRDRDLFVFCFNGSNGQFTAHEAFITRDVRDLRDANGAPFGAELYSKAEQGRLNEVAFIAPVPGSTELAIKSAYVTRIGDQVCGVSAYQIEGGHDRAIRSAQRQRW